MKATGHWKFGFKKMNMIAGVPLVLGLAILATKPWLDFTFNQSESLPGVLYVTVKGLAARQNDLVAFHWHGGYHYAPGSMFIKRLSGMPGQTVVMKGREVWLSGEYMGYAKPFTKKGLPLEAAKSHTIAFGQYFVTTPHVDSFDSKYAAVGDIYQKDLIGRTYEVF